MKIRNDIPRLLKRHINIMILYVLLLILAIYFKLVFKV